MTDPTGHQGISESQYDGTDDKLREIQEQQEEENKIAADLQFREIPTVQFEELGSVSLLAKELTLCINVGESKEFREQALASFRQTAALKNGSKAAYINQDLGGLQMRQATTAHAAPREVLCCCWFYRSAMGMLVIKRRTVIRQGHEQVLFDTFLSAMVNMTPCDKI